MPRKNSKARKVKQPKITPTIKRKQLMLQKMQDYIEKYVDSYNKPEHLSWLKESSILDDFLYGVALSIDENKYRGADGYDDFKKMLAQRFMMEMLKNEIR